jgi:hypothetical protein
VLGDSGNKAKEQKKAEDLLQKAEEDIKILHEFHNEVKKNWSTENECVLGSVWQG